MRIEFCCHNQVAILSRHTSNTRLSSKIPTHPRRYELLCMSSHGNWGAAVSHKTGTVMWITSPLLIAVMRQIQRLSSTWNMELETTSVWKFRVVFVFSHYLNKSTEIRRYPKELWRSRSVSCVVNRVTRIRFRLVTPRTSHSHSWHLNFCPLNWNSEEESSTGFRIALNQQNATTNSK